MTVKYGSRSERSGEQLANSLIPGVGATINFLDHLLLGFPALPSAVIGSWLNHNGKVSEQAAPLASRLLALLPPGGSPNVSFS